MDTQHQSWRARDQHAPGSRVFTANEVFLTFDHTARGKGKGRLRVDNPALRRAAAAVLRAVRDDRLDLYVSSGWVLLPPRIAALLSPLSFDLERRVLNHYPRRELPVRLQSRVYTWSQVRAFRRLYAQTRQAQPSGLLDDSEETSMLLEVATLWGAIGRRLRRDATPAPPAPKTWD